jgi:hypothetical protein
MAKLKKNSCLCFAKILIVIGVIIIILFSLILPFNDRSWNSSAELFGQYGDFIGGLVGSLFSLAGFFILYETLNTQIEELTQEKQHNKITIFENNFFKSLDNQDTMVSRITAYFYGLDGIEENMKTIKGVDFFLYAMCEIQKINETLLHNKYIGIYEGKGLEKEMTERQLDELSDYQNFKIHPDEAQYKKSEIMKLRKLQYVNYYYGISEAQWGKIRNEKKPYKKHLLVYELFSKKYSYAFSIYMRNLFHLLDLIEKQNNLIDKTKNDCYDYAQTIKNQMSPFELTFLYYHILSSTEKIKLIKKYAILENLNMNDLIDRRYFEHEMKIIS